MRTEDWQISYDVRLREQVIHKDETLKCKEGYHDRLKRFWKKHKCGPEECDPIYKVRGNYVELLSLGLEGGINLPLNPTKDLEGAVLLYDEKHPIKLIAPNGSEYRHVE